MDMAIRKVRLSSVLGTAELSFSFTMQLVELGNDGGSLV